jgi:hypothetical protein
MSITLDPSVSSPRARALALRDVLDAAGTIGVEAAVATYGSLLADSDRALVLGLSTSEVADLQDLDSSLHALDRIAADNNNNL